MSGMRLNLVHVRHKNHQRFSVHVKLSRSRLSSCIAISAQDEELTCPPAVRLVFLILRLNFCQKLSFLVHVVDVYVVLQTIQCRSAEEFVPTATQHIVYTVDR